MQKILIYGKGGHGKVVEDTFLQLFPEGSIEYFDDATNPYDPSYCVANNVITAIGNNEVRKQIVERVKHEFSSLIHPTAYVSPLATIGVGTVILANAVVQANAIIGDHCIINANVTVDHDAIVEDFVCTYPGSYVAGFAHVTELKTVLPCQVVWKGEIL